MRLQTEIITPQKEVTEAHFFEMLGALPPERMDGHRAFLVGEPYGTINGEQCFELYFQRDSKFYSGGYCSTKTFDGMLIPVESEAK